MTLPLTYANSHPYDSLFSATAALMSLLFSLISLNNDPLIFILIAAVHRGCFSLKMSSQMNRGTARSFFLLNQFHRAHKRLHWTPSNCFSWGTAAPVADFASSPMDGEGATCLSYQRDADCSVAGWLRWKRPWRTLGEANANAFKRWMTWKTEASWLLALGSSCRVNGRSPNPLHLFKARTGMGFFPPKGVLKTYKTFSSCNSACSNLCVETNIYQLLQRPRSLSKSHLWGLRQISGHIIQFSLLIFTLSIYSK